MALVQMSGFWSTVETIGKGALTVINPLPAIIGAAGSAASSVISATGTASAQVLGSLRPQGGALPAYYAGGSGGAGGEPSGMSSSLPLILGGLAAAGILVVALTRPRRHGGHT